MSKVVKLESVSITLPDGRPLLRDLSFHVNEGEFLVITGPSAAGKTTILDLVVQHAIKMNSALPRAFYEGEIHISRGEGKNNDVGYVMQERSLYPWLSVLDNVARPLVWGGLSEVEARKQAAEALTDLGVAHEIFKNYPDKISGGEKQRVELARTLVRYPLLWVLDEPFQQLDAQTRKQCQLVLLRALSLQRKKRDCNPTVLFVTHSGIEASFLADRVIFIGGRPARVVDELKIERKINRFEKSYDYYTCDEFEEIRDQFLQRLHPILALDESISKESLE